MPLQLNRGLVLRDLLAERSPLIGMWICSGSPVVAELCAGAGFDWLLIDAEHSPNGFESIAAQLQATTGYAPATVVRPAALDAVVIKQYLDLGVQNLLIPMIDTAAQAEAAVAAMRYPPRGVRGVGAALARAARWGRDADYLHQAEETLSLVVQIESTEAVQNLDDILQVEGIDGIFIGPSDLAASMGHLGRAEHPEVIAVVERCIETAASAGVPVGVNAFKHEIARRYLDLGANFILVGADVSILARGAESLAQMTAG